MSDSHQNKTWKSLKDSNIKKPISWRARLRRIFKFFKFLFTIAILSALGYGAYWLYENGIIQKALAPTAEDLRKVEYKTNGYISQKWLIKNKFFPPQKNLAEIDVVELKRNLESISQVRSADVIKIYPDTIRIEIKEYVPVARVAVIQNEKYEEYILSKDGFFFRPICIAQSEIQDMPYLTGIPLITSINKIFEPYAYAPKIFELIELAKKSIPENYKKWRVINVAEMGSLTLPIMLVLTADGTRIIFHSNDIATQIDKLEYVLNYYKNEDLAMIEKIDLSLSARAIITIRPSENER